MSRDKRICAKCVGDPYLESQITELGRVGVPCDFCASIGATFDFGQIADIVDAAIEAFYDPNFEEDWVEDWEPSGDSLLEVLQELIDLPDGAHEILEDVLSEDWFDYSSHDRKYGEDPHFFQASKLADTLSHEWRAMENSLRHTARLINPGVSTMLENVFGPVIHDTTYDGRPVIVEIGPSCPIDHLFRGRVFQSTEAMEEALSHPERHIGPPPQGKGAAGRMNAKGVSVFYGATTKEIAKAEVRPPVGSYVVVAQFNVTRKLRLLDLHALGAVGGNPDASLLDPKTADDARRAAFLGNLTKRIVMPVMPELEDQDYLITQAIADFLATHSALNLDGILFRSAQDALTQATASGRNVVLFNKASTVTRSAERYRGDTKAHVWETDDDGTKFEPVIYSGTLVEESRRPIPDLFGKEESTLELDRNEIEIFSITHVNYGSLSYDVKNMSNRATLVGRADADSPSDPF